MNQAAGLKLGATKGKLALIALLGVVLVGVIVSNLSGEASSSVAPAESDGQVAGPTAEAPQPATQAPITEDAIATASGPFGPFATDEAWPTPGLDEVVRFDPLAMPAWAGPPPPSEVETGREFSAEELTELQNAENAIILVTGSKRVALIGEHEYQVGDMIGGLRISDISSSGIVLSEPE